MALNPVGICTAISTSGSAATSTVLTHQSQYLRCVALTQGAHVAIGTNPTATPANFFVSTSDPEIICLHKPAAQRVVGIETGSTTTLSFPEGVIGSPFAVGEAVALTVTGQSGFDFSNKIVLSITQQATSEPYLTKVVIDHDSSSGAPDQTRDGLGTYAELRGVFKVSALGLGSGTLYIQQVQET
jgi:hypothetical protein